MKACIQLQDWDALGRSEESFFNELGFGGTRDYIGPSSIDGSAILILADWKTQEVKELNKDGTIKVKFYPEWAYQLAAYRLGTEVPAGNCFSMVISTNPDLPGVKVKRWPATHKSHMNILSATGIFLSLLQTWKLIHHFPSPLLNEGAFAAAMNSALSVADTAAA